MNDILDSDGHWPWMAECPSESCRMHQSENERGVKSVQT